MALAMSFRIIVLPALGGDVISARCPFPMGAMRSMMRVVSPPDLASRLNFSSG